MRLLVAAPVRRVPWCLISGRSALFSTSSVAGGSYAAGEQGKFGAEMRQQSQGGDGRWFLKMRNLMPSALFFGALMGMVYYRNKANMLEEQLKEARGNGEQAAINLIAPRFVPIASKFWGKKADPKIEKLVNDEVGQQKHQIPIINDESSKTQPSETVPKFQDAIADAAEKVLPCVVNLRVEEEHTGFMRNKVFVSLGSGFFIEEEGTILTNAHVVSGFPDHKSKIIITLSDGREFDGIVYSMDIISDLAVVKVTNSTEFFSAAKLGSSKKMRPGDWVVALGSPLGFHNSVSAGVISAISRMSSELGQMKNNLEFYQTDLTVNEGNSGGPLINLKGEVIGINTIRTETSGLSFAIRIDTAMEFIRQLNEEGKIVRPWIGLKMVTLTPLLLKDIIPEDLERLPTKSGVLITSVFDKSPASLAGLKSGDVITQVNRNLVFTSADVVKVIGNKVGEEIQVQFLRKQRDGEIAKITTTIIPAELDIYSQKKEAQFVFQP